MKTKKRKSSGKPEDALHHHDDESSSIINVGLHRVSSRVDADGSAEAMLSNSNSSLFATAAPLPMTRTMSTPLQGSSIPLSRTKSNPLGGMSYTMRRVLSSRDDRGSSGQHDQDAFFEQETEGLVVNSRVKGVYNRGDVEIILNNDDQSLPPTPLVRRKSSLSAYSMKNIFSKRQDDDQWQSESEGENVCRGEDGTLLQGGYDLRQVQSTPLQGMENGYALQRAKTTGYEQQQQQQQSSLYQEERIYNPLSLVRSRLSSIGRNVSRGGGGKEEDDTNGKDDDMSNDDELSFISESIESSSNPSTIPNSQRKKKKKRSKYSLYHLLFAAMMISAGVAGTGVHLLLKAGGEDEGGGEVSNAVVMISEEEEGEGITSAVEESTGSSSVGEDVALKVPEVLSEDENAVEDGILVENGDRVKDEDILEDIVTAEESGEVTTTTTTTTTTTPPPSSDTITTFYVMADAPYTDYERNILMPKHIEELDDTVEFLFHLGDLQWAKVDRCREGAYNESSTIMQRSRIPTFILPGDNDINDCNSMIHGEEMWTKYFALFDKRYDHSLNVTRWGKLNESFSFIHKEVLYLGLNIIGGRPASSYEKRFRHRQHLERIRAIFNDQLDNFKVVVMLGHAEPGQYHLDFFQGDAGFISMMKEMGKPTIHFHGDWHAYYEREAEYGVDNYMRISLDGESSAPPILVSIDTSKTNPVKFDRRSKNLEVACCSEGWPRYDGRVVNTPRPN